MATRDLSAFAAPAETRSRRSPQRSAQRSTANDPRSSRRQGGTPRGTHSATPPRQSHDSRPIRVTLNLPVVTAERLRTRAEEESTYYLDVVVHCFAAYSTASPEPAADGFRRRPPAGRIQIPINVAPDVLATIDAAAARAGDSRSAYLTRAIDDQLS